ncbi:TIGR03085 family metal-binding protein [Actinophytocola oryzae]|uniref:Uncharacterized protein (TIGR03085 family) n=1 Tax=Actinophytocola oryzae TaxID=502181 RepID=A0A4R7VBJ6_9PSEU|nr:TIGR03085 family metal-binding protein [Actinophytocola oryzae]TDV46355.1 uncharacterized protein (TIGR03085 family) [Actinophytocola oryzae]
MSVSSDERAALCDLFDRLGPHEPTLCRGWQTRDLAAHLVVRERRPDAAPGILLKPFAGHTRRVQDSYARRPWRELVDLVRGGPPAFWPTRLPAVDSAVNSVEFFVHHEDARRGQDGWEPREPDAARDAAVWTGVRRTSRMTLRRSPVGLVLRTPGGEEVVAKRGPDTVTVTGLPGELLLFVTGRDAIRVGYEGGREAVAAVQGLRRGL